MTEPGYEQVPGTPGVPPIQAGDLGLPQGPSSWPTVIGIIAIIVGALGALGGIWGTISPLFMDAFMSIAPQGPAPDVSYLGRWAWWTVLGSLLAFALGVLLLVAGIGLLKRSTWACTACLTWAVLKMLLVVVSAGITYLIQRDATAAMSQGGSQTVAMPAGFARVFVAFVAYFVLVWGWALPVFMLIWFSRGRIRKEVAEWGSTPADFGAPPSVPWSGT